MPGITLGPKPPSASPVAPPKGVATDAGAAPAGADANNSGSSNAVAPPAAAQPTTTGNVSLSPAHLPPSDTSTAQSATNGSISTTTIHVQPKQCSISSSSSSAPSSCTYPTINLGPTTIGAAAQQQHHPPGNVSQHATGHISIPVNDRAAPKEGKPSSSNRGGIANGITFFMLGIGLVLQFFLHEDARKFNFVLAVGVFGFAGGITNWLAVKMLFDKIPGLYGSGVIPMQYQNIRKTVKNEIMHTFFDENYLKGYIRQRAPELLRRLNISERLMKVINAPDFDGKMAAKLEEISATPQGMLLAMVKTMMGGSLIGLVPMVKPPLISIATEIAKELTTMENEDDGESVVELIPVDVVRSEIDALMTERLATLTPEVVKELLENVIRDHLGWLVVWGNIFGSIIGIIALLVTGEV